MSDRNMFEELMSGLDDLRADRKQLREMEGSVIAIAKQLEISPDSYQSWNLLFDGIGHRINELNLQTADTIEDKEVL